MKGWKVVKKIDTQFFSLLITGLSEDGVEYIPGQRTRPQKGCGPLAVFSSKEAADLFMLREAGESRGLVALPCLYKPSKAKSLWLKNKFLGRVPLHQLPFGTRFAKEVILKTPGKEDQT